MNSIFKQLTKGVNFNTNAYKDEAVKFGLVKPKDEVSREAAVTLPDIEIIKKQVEDKKRRAEEDSDSCQDDLTILGAITSAKKQKKKKKKLKHNNELVKELYTEKVNQFKNVHKIHTEGTDVPTPISEWKMLVDRYGVSETMFNNIVYPTPTPIQMQTIPLMLQSREVLSCAPTGSGKTAAFLIPILHHLQKPQNGGYRAVIVVPTRELATQIERECTKLCQGTGLRPFSQTKVKEKEYDKIKKVKHDILITPPNRLVYMINHDPPLINLDKVQWLIIDEADKLFEAGDTGFREQLATIYTSCSGPEIKRGMFSATLGPSVSSWCKLNLDNAVSVRVGAGQAATDTIHQTLQYCGNEHGKLVQFRSLVQKGLQPPVLIFVQSKERAQDLFKELLYDGIHVDVIHSERSQLQRENTVRAFRSGGIWVLICTELMGRGIDFKGVNLVINYDFPPSAVSYIHRVGRTGRAGRPGQAITYYTEQDKPLLRSIAQVMQNSGCEVPDFLLKLKTTRDKKKRDRVVKRAWVSKTAHFENVKEKNKRAAIKATKKKKLEAASETPKDNEVASTPSKKKKVDSSNQGKVSKKTKKGKSWHESTNKVISSKKKKKKIIDEAVF